MAREKVRQASALLEEFGLPLWIVQFARESHDNPQPIGSLAVGTSVTWPAAFIVTATGDSTAIVASLDADNVRAVGAYENIVTYVKDIGPPLREYLDRVAPQSIGVSYAVDDESADNITHGMYLLLCRLLEGTRYRERLTTAQHVAAALRARKTPEEVRRIRMSVDATLEMFRLIEARIEIGMTESDLYNAIQDSLHARRLDTAWDSRYCPTVSFGPDSTFGHVGPGSIALRPGMLVHVDLGLRIDGYCSDLQRTWYVLGESETRAPDDVQRAFEIVRRAIEAGRSVLRPGVRGFEVDAAGRNVLTDAGYDEPAFALGHQLGQSTHDAGTLLGPPWPRYGDRPQGLVESSNVFTLEYALRTSAGTIGQEEDVLVTENGAAYMSSPQIELSCLRL